MRIFIVRHGETDQNKNRILQGQLNTKLNETGLRQAKNISERLKDEDFVKIYSSDLDRCKSTAEYIAQHHKSNIVYDKRLRERDFGIFNGKKGKEIDWNSLQGELMHQKPSGGESFHEVITRVKAFFDELIVKEEKDILIVCHGGTIKAMLSFLFSINIEELILNLKPKNTTLYVIEKSGDKFSLVLENCNKHNK